MRIFLTESRTASTEETTLIADHTFPQKVHYFPELQPGQDRPGLSGPRGGPKGT